VLRVRPLEPADIPILQEMAARSGYPYPNLTGPQIEEVCVVVDDGNVLMACAAKRIVELYLYVGEASPIVKKRCLRLLHREMATRLRNLLYTQANAAIPEPLSRSFGRRLVRSFGWAKSRWSNWFIDL
jgi:hypothetical protein